ncbi:MAG: Uma2 family endonuclease [Lachnospiraceae bacterium]|nr:Uma2 family endonuclease [Lachnospiraceae bacterium]
MICDPNKLTKQGCTGAPDWIIEIVSPGNEGYDYLRKFRLYNAAGVREYWIADPQQEGVLVHELEDEKMYSSLYSMKDQVRVGIYEDLTIDFADISARLQETSAQSHLGGYRSVLS